MWNIIMLENIGVKNMQKGTITIDIFLLMNLAQFFGARVCWCLLAGKKASWESTDNSPRLELEHQYQLVQEGSSSVSPPRPRSRGHTLSCYCDAKRLPELPYGLWGLVYSWMTLLGLRNPCKGKKLCRWHCIHRNRTKSSNARAVCWRSTNLSLGVCSELGKYLESAFKYLLVKTSLSSP